MNVEFKKFEKGYWCVLGGVRVSAIVELKSGWIVLRYGEYDLSNVLPDSFKGSGGSGGLDRAKDRFFELLSYYTKQG